MSSGRVWPNCSTSRMWASRSSAWTRHRPARRRVGTPAGRRRRRGRPLVRTRPGRMLLAGLGQRRAWHQSRYSPAGRPAGHLRRCPRHDHRRHPDPAARPDAAPWADLKGQPLDARGLARLLDDYDITSKKVKVDGRSAWGYRAEHLADAWTRYVPPPTPAETEAAEPPGFHASAGTLRMASSDVAVIIHPQVKSISGAGTPATAGA